MTTNNFGMPFVYFLFFLPWKFLSVSSSNPELDPFAGGLQWISRNLRLCTIEGPTSQ